MASAWRFDSSLTDQALVVQGIAHAVPDREVARSNRAEGATARFSLLRPDVHIERGAKADWPWMDSTAA